MLTCLQFWWLNCSWLRSFTTQTYSNGGQYDDWSILWEDIASSFFCKCMRDLPSYNAVPSLGGAFLHFPRGYPIYIQCAGSSYSNFILALLAEEPNFPVAGRLFSLSLLHLFLHFNALAFPPIGLDFFLPEKHPCILSPADAFSPLQMQLPVVGQARCLPC